MKNKDQKGWFQSCQYRISDEGFDYTFEGYSDWKEIEDEEFHRLRKEYLDARKKLNNYIDEKSK